MTPTTDAELAQHLAELISVDLAAKLAEPIDAATREIALQDACDSTYETLTRLGARDVVFEPLGEDHAVRVKFSLPPRDWLLVLDVEYGDEEQP